MCNDFFSSIMRARSLQSFHKGLTQTLIEYKYEVDVAESHLVIFLLFDVC